MPVHLKSRVIVPKRRSSYILVNAFGDDKRPGSLMLEARRLCRKTAGQMAKEMRDSIYQDRYKKPELSPGYLDWKLRKGLDPRILIATRRYVRSIGVVKTRYGAIIGLTRKTRIDRKGKKSRRIPYALLQRWLEYGTRKAIVLPSGKKKKGKIGSRMPARPHWRPMMRYWKNSRRSYALRIKNHVGVELQKLVAKGRLQPGR